MAVSAAYVASISTRCLRLRLLSWWLRVRGPTVVTVLTRSHSEKLANLKRLDTALVVSRVIHRMILGPIFGMFCGVLTGIVSRAFFGVSRSLLRHRVRMARRSLAPASVLIDLTVLPLVVLHVILRHPVWSRTTGFRPVLRPLGLCMTHGSIGLSVG